MKRPHILFHQTFCGKYERRFDWLYRFLWPDNTRSWHGRIRFWLFLQWAWRAHWAVEDESVYEWMRQAERN